MPSSTKDNISRTSLLLWLLAMPGVVGMAATMLPPLLRTLPDAPPLWLPVGAAILQSALLLAAAAWAGARFAPRVGLASPLLSALIAGNPGSVPLKKPLAAGLLAGIAGGLLLFLTISNAPPEFASARSDVELGLLWRVLYGGITEEVLLRWGVMSVLAWLAWRMLQGGSGTPRAICFWIAIVISAVFFGVGHLPAVAAQAGSLSASLAGYVIAANSVFGLLFGYLFWRHGLEAAILAHALSHVVAYLVGKV